MTIEITVRDNENKWRWNSWAILPSSPEPEPTSVREKERKEREQTHLLIKDNFWEDFATTDKAGLLLNNIIILCVSVCVSDLACVCTSVYVWFNVYEYVSVCVCTLHADTSVCIGHVTIRTIPNSHQKCLCDHVLYFPLLNMLMWYIFLYAHLNPSESF